MVGCTARVAVGGLGVAGFRVGGFEVGAVVGKGSAVAVGAGVSVALGSGVKVGRGVRVGVTVAWAIKTLTGLHAKAPTNKTAASASPISCFFKNISLGSPPETCVIIA